MVKTKLFKWSIVVIIIHLAIVLYFSGMIGTEGRIPIHWNYRGEIDSEAGRDFGLWFFWGFNALILVVFILFSQFSPRYKRNSERFDLILPKLALVLSFFMMIMHLYMLLLAVGFPYLNREKSIFILIGLLFIFLGNLLPKIPSNFIAGVRTPWTLTSDRNWHKTHRVSGFVFVIGGVLMLLRGIVNMRSPFTIIHTFGILALLLLYPILYSYILFLKEKKEKAGEE